MNKTLIIGLTEPDIYRTHQIVAAYFDGAHHLWRRDGDNVTVYSDAAPTGELSDGMSCACTPLPALEVGQTFPVLLRVNACVHVGEQYFPRNVQEVPAWLAARTPGLVWDSLKLLQYQRLRTRKQDLDIPISVCDITGMVTIQDPVSAESVFRRGVGRARRFGCGMLLRL